MSPHLLPANRNAYDFLFYGSSLYKMCEDIMSISRHSNITVAQLSVYMLGGILLEKSSISQTDYLPVPLHPPC